MLKNRIQFGILLAFSFGLYIFTNQYFTFILFLLFLIFPALSFILLVLSFKNITFDFEIPAVIKKTEAAVINFTLANPSFFPASGAAFNILSRNNLTGKTVNTKAFCVIENKKSTRTSFAITDINTGKISVTINKLLVCDILGLFSLSKKVHCEKSGLIYPDTCDIKIDMEKQPEISGDGEHYSQTKKGQDVNEIFALREYTQGDEIRKIHWKLSAKQERLVVRDFGLSLGTPVFLLLEIYDSKGGNSVEAIEACLMTFVSVSRSLIAKGICHSIAWYDSEGEKLIIKEIESSDELEAYLPELLSIRSYHEDAIALKLFEASNYRNMGLTLYYITTKVNREEIEKRSLYQPIKTIYVTDEKTDDANDSNIITVSPENIKSDIEKITV